MSHLARLQQLFDQLTDLDPAARAAVLDRECVDAPELRAELEALLASDEALAQHTARKAVGQLDAMLLDAQPESLVGAQVGRYTLIKPIGAGGMGAVYLAERNDGVVQQRVAIKFLARDLLAEGFRQRFELERHVLAQLDHPSITRLIDADELADGTPYYVMDYVEGVPITRYASEQRLDLRARLALMVEVAKAVAHAHQALIVHRDLKPGNILVDAQGQPKLLDFGIAKPLAAQLGGQLISQTITGQRFFSPQHAAPEQLLGEPITVGCDIYGLGTLLYELLTGEAALSLTGLSAAEAETKILHQMPDPPSQRVARREQASARGKSNGASAQAPADSAPTNGKAGGAPQLPDIPARSLRGELDAIVLNCLRKRASERYRSVDDLITDLQAYLDGRPVQARGGHGWYRARKFIARHRWAATAAGLTALALIGSSVLTYLQSREAQSQRDTAQLALTDAEQQRDRAQRVTQFLIDAFAAANPGGELGKDVTAREILERGAKQLETDLEDQPQLKAQLLGTIAQAQLALSLVDEAEATVDRMRELIDDASPRSLRFKLNELQARVHLSERDTAAASKSIDAAGENAQGIDELLVHADLHTSYLYGHGKQVELIDFVQSFRQRNPVRILDLGVPDPYYRVRLREASCLVLQKRTDEAMRVLVDLQGEMSTAPPSDRSVLFDLDRRLAQAYRTSDQPDLAAEITERSAESSRDYFGEHSKQYSDAISAHAIALTTLGRHQEAVDMNRKVLEIRSRLFSPDSPALATIYHNMGLALQHTGQLEEALSSHESAVRISDSSQPRDSKARFTFKMTLAGLLAEMHRCNEAGSLMETAVEDFRRSPNFSTAAARSFVPEINETCTDSSKANSKGEADK